jgi:transposase
LKAQATFPRPTIRQVSQWLLKRNEELNLQQQRFVEHLCHLSPTLQAVHRLGQTFQQIVQQQESARFDQWLVEAEQSMVVELKEFAARLRQDYGAVVAALEYPWSNGQVEGQVNKLKLIKRQMYGRAKLDLLKARMLQAS